MIGYETEEQQVQAIKKFWKDNGIAIVAGAIIGLGLLWGWRFYNDSKIEAQESASTAFESGIESLADGDDKTQLAEFLDQNPDNGYAPLAAMILAKTAVDEKDYEAAKNALTSATSGESALADVARLRLANLHIQLTEYANAITVLNQVKSDAFEGQVEELRGDALYAKGEFEAANDAYTKAIALVPTNRNLKMKRDNIAYAKNQATGEDVE